MIIPADRLAVLEATTPPAETVRERVRTYIEIADLPIAELARRAGYGATSVRHFMKDQYTKFGISDTDVRIRAALVDYMDAHPLGVLNVDGPGRLYETANVRVIRDWFNRCLAQRSMVVVYGPPASQKTFTLHHLIAEHNRREIPKNGHGTRAYWVYCRQDVTPRALLSEICRTAGLPSSSHTSRMISNLEHHLGARKVVFALDEAQHLNIPCLEIVRHINDNPPHCGILLFGSHRLYALFNERAAELEQWNSRLQDTVALPGIEKEEVLSIIEAEMGSLPAPVIAHLIQSCTVADAYSPKKGAKYFSVRRLCQQIALIKTDPRFAPTTNQPSKEGAAA